jgi:hypothetical protein
MRALREKKEQVYRLGEIAAGPRGVLLV